MTQEEKRIADFVDNLIEQAGVSFVIKVLMDEDMRKIASALSPNNEMLSVMNDQYENYKKKINKTLSTLVMQYFERGMKEWEYA